MDKILILHEMGQINLNPYLNGHGTKKPNPKWVLPGFMAVARVNEVHGGFRFPKWRGFHAKQQKVCLSPRDKIILLSAEPFSVG